MSTKKEKTKRSRTLMLVQALQHLPLYLDSLEKIIAYLKKEFSDAEWALIIHDKDVEKDGTPKHIHIHISFHFKNARTAESIANKFGVKPQYVEVFSGQYAKQNAFSYLIHKTSGAEAEGKYPYDIDLVTANFDYKQYIEQCLTTVEANTKNLDEVMAKIISGKLILKDFFTDSILGDASSNALFYTNNKTKIDKAIEARYKLQQVKREDINLEIIYIQGDAGSGKTTLAKEYALRKYGDYFMTGSSNDSVQDYMGEPVAIFDDARPSDFTASDWLKLLDPYNNNASITSRYYNKYLAVKCIIITTTTPFQDFFVYAKNKAGVAEPVAQFMRRFSAVIHVKRDINSLGQDVARGYIYTVRKLATPIRRQVGAEMVKYDYQLEAVKDGVIDVVIPEANNLGVVQDLKRYF